MEIQIKNSKLGLREILCKMERNDRVEFLEKNSLLLRIDGRHADREHDA